MPTPIDYRLPDSLMSEIEMAARALPPMQALNIAVLSALGYGIWLGSGPSETWEQANVEGDKISAIWRDVETVDPTNYRLDRVQFEQISTWLMTVPDASDIARTNLGLDWINYGPSASAEATAA